MPKLNGLYAIVLIFGLCAGVACRANVSVIFYGAGNYDDCAGSPDSPIFHAMDSQFVQPGAGSDPRKREILRNNVRDLLVQVGSVPLTVIINDICESAAKSAERELSDIVKLTPNLTVQISVTDFTQSNLRTDLAYLDNPVEDWFYDPKTAKPFLTARGANPNAEILQRVANLSRGGLLITTYYHDAIEALGRLSSLRFVDLGEGYPYIWPDGKVDGRKTTRYLVPNSMAGSDNSPSFPGRRQGATCACKIDKDC